MKGKYFIILFVLAVFAFCFVKIIYPILNISSVYPPMKEYNFSLSAYELVNKINKIDKENNSLIFKITATTGTSNDYKYYADIFLKNDTSLYTFKVFYLEPNKRHSKIGLVGAFDDINKFGGYQNNSKDMQNLITIFEDNFIDIINKN